jgi:hypothetical protein
MIDEKPTPVRREYDREHDYYRCFCESVKSEYVRGNDSHDVQSWATERDDAAVVGL